MMRMAFCSQVGEIAGTINLGLAFILPLFLAAQWAWYGKDGTDEEIDQALNQLVYHGSNTHPGKILMEFGKLDHTMDSQIPNASLAWNLLLALSLKSILHS